MTQTVDGDEWLQQWLQQDDKSNKI